MNEFTGKRAVVTGGTRGIGAAIAQRLREEGAEVLITARSGADEPDFIRADVRTREGIEAIAAAAGEVDILVHNAGGAAPYDSASAIPDEVWQDALDLNYLASVRLNALLVPGMQNRGDGRIVHISSAATLTPMGPFLHYTAAKAALENYSRGLALELAPAGIRVNTVSPGRTATPGGEETRKQWAEDTLPGVPLGRDGLPGDIADAVLFLVSDRASWLTGRNLIVDGGEFPIG
ncbi:SDR family oxidoreductase [Pseudonocardiaceae bacterium YIM PH 21723]|nr:SDR family oxidoreductase [Pseudonocardiaceae bacterium YIM PH 21723]